MNKHHDKSVEIRVETQCIGEEEGECGLLLCRSDGRMQKRLLLLGYIVPLELLVLPLPILLPLRN